MWYMHEGMSWWTMFGGIWMLAFWGGLIALIVWGIKKLTEHTEPKSDATEIHKPLEIAKKRYAEGEISRDEFEQIKKDVS